MYSTTRVESLTSHEYGQVRRNPGDQYDCEDRFVILLERMGRIRRLDMKAEDPPPEPPREIPSVSSEVEPVKRRPGRPKGSGIGHYKRKDLRAEE